MKIKKAVSRASSRVNVDFLAALFISRAFADELLNVIEAMKVQGKDSFDKIEPRCEEMLQLVKHQRKTILRELKEAE